MNLEIDFHNSEISGVKIGLGQIEIYFSHAVVVSHSTQDLSETKPFAVKAHIIIGKPKYKKLPGNVKLSDGELYGIPGKALNGRVPVNLLFDRDCELVLSDQSNDYTIYGKNIRIVADLTTLPATWRLS